MTSKHSRRPANRISLLAAATAASLLTAFATAATGAGDNSSQLQGEALTATTWEVDSRGRPPFDRTRVEVPVVDVASMETLSSAPVETVTVWSVDFSGKPPYKRSRVEVPVVDASSLQLEESSQSRTRFRGKPPFRRN